MKGVWKLTLAAVLAALLATSVSGCFFRTRRRACPVGMVRFRAVVRACAHPGVRRVVYVCAPNGVRARIKAKNVFRNQTRRPCAVVVPGSLRRR